MGLIVLLSNDPGNRSPLQHIHGDAYIRHCLATGAIISDCRDFTGEPDRFGKALREIPLFSKYARGGMMDIPTEVGLE